MERTPARGTTLIEVLVALTVLAVLVSTALPNLVEVVDRRRLGGAAETLQTTLQLARSEGIKQMRPMVVTYRMDGSANWKVGMRDGSECDPDLADPDDSDACSIPVGAERVLKTWDSGQFPAILASANRPFTRFDPVRATAMGSNVTVTFSSEAGEEVRVIVGNIGRIRSCSPVGVPGYAPC